MATVPAGRSSRRSVKARIRRSVSAPKVVAAASSRVSRFSALGRRLDRRYLAIPAAAAAGLLLAGAARRFRNGA